MRRRRLLALLGVLPLAGCGGLLGESDRASATVTADPAEPQLDAPGLADAVARLRERYGVHGVWGVDGTAPGSLPLVGAWTGDRGLPAPGGPDLQVPADHVLALYRAPDGYRCWCWSAARPAQPEGVSRAKLTALSARVEAASGTVTGRAPTANYGADESPVTVGPPAPEPPEPRARLRIEAGRIAAREAENGVAVGWAGGRAGMQSVVATCAIEADVPPTLTWEVSLTAGQGTL